jgi:S-adenosyl methyltransferase
MDAVVKQWNEGGGSPHLMLRDPAQVGGFFDGLELLEPGVLSTALWRPELMMGGPPNAIDDFGAWPGRTDGGGRGRGGGGPPPRRGAYRCSAMMGARFCVMVWCPWSLGCTESDRSLSLSQSVVSTKETLASPSPITVSTAAWVSVP